MPSRRSNIAMTEAEQAQFMQQVKTLQVASLGPQGWPHLVAMWFKVVDGKIHFSTYGTSQKVMNLRRNPRITCMLEDGETYDQLRGLVIEGQADIIDHPPDVLHYLQAIGDNLGQEPTEQQKAMSTKRVIVRVNPERAYSWDHRKLGGRY